MGEGTTGARLLVADGIENGSPADALFSFGGGDVQPNSKISNKKQRDFITFPFMA